MSAQRQQQAKNVVTYKTNEIPARPVIFVENDTVVIVVCVFGVPEISKSLVMRVSSDHFSLFSVTAEE